MTPDEAIAAGAMALFGEKYGDEVRVLSMGRDVDADYSVELCGGTHVSALGDIQLFKIVSESAVSSGVRRIEALTGEAARQWLTDRELKLREAAATLKSAPDEVPARVAALVEERRRLERELAEAKKALAMGGGGKAEAAAPEQVGGHAFLGQVVEGLDPKGLAFRDRCDEAAGRVGHRRAGRGQRRPRQRRRRRHRRPGRPAQRGRSGQGRGSGARRAGRRRPARHGPGRRSGRCQGRRKRSRRSRTRWRRLRLRRRSVAQPSAPKPRRFLELGFGLDLLAQLVALLVDRRDHRAHRDAEVDQRRLRQLQRRLQRLRHGVGHARLVELGGMLGVAGAGDDRQVGEGCRARRG